MVDPKNAPSNAQVVSYVSERVKLTPGVICKESYELLNREICDDRDPRWPELRTRHLSAGVASRTLKKRIYGAGGYGSYSALLRWYKDPIYRQQEQQKLDQNPYCQHGLKYQAEAAALYSAKSGYTLAPLGFLAGPLKEAKGFSQIPDFISATFDYLVLDEPILVEIKCPTKFHENWKEKYWVQCQHQLQLARFKTLHLVMYIPPNLHEKARMEIREIHVDTAWFNRALPHYEAFWKLVNSK